jgi:hypothetical protein
MNKGQTEVAVQLLTARSCAVVLDLSGSFEICLWYMCGKYCARPWSAISARPIFKQE